MVTLTAPNAPIGKPELELESGNLHRPGITEQLRVAISTVEFRVRVLLPVVYQELVPSSRSKVVQP